MNDKEVKTYIIRTSLKYNRPVGFHWVSCIVPETDIGLPGPHHVAICQQILGEYLYFHTRVQFLHPHRQIPLNVIQLDSYLSQPLQLYNCSIDKERLDSPRGLKP